MSKVVIPDKMFFKIGEVAKITGVKPYILRYWETEFPHLRPSKGRSQHRLYRRKDVEDIVRIKELLYAEKFTIAGARQILKGGDPAESSAAAQAALAMAPAPVAPLPPEPAKVDPRLREELLAIRELVGRL